MARFLIKFVRIPRQTCVYNGELLVVADVKFTCVSNVLSGGSNVCILVEVTVFLAVGSLLFFSEIFTPSRRLGVEYAAFVKKIFVVVVEDVQTGLGGVRRSSFSTNPTLSFKLRLSC